MNSNQQEPEHSALEHFLQTHSKTSSLSEGARSRMLNQATKQLIEEQHESDYTWGQFSLRLSSLVAALFFVVFCCEEFISPEQLTERPIEEAPTVQTHSVFNDINLPYYQLSMLSNNQDADQNTWLELRHKQSK